MYGWIEEAMFQWKVAGLLADKDSRGEESEDEHDVREYKRAPGKQMHSDNYN